MIAPVALNEHSKPAFAAHAKFRFNKVRQQWVILAPERLLEPDETAVIILKMCDGARTIAAIVDELVTQYQAEQAKIAGDVLELLQRLADKGFIQDHADTKV